MTTTTGEILEYPMVTDTALEVAPIFAELQQRGPIKVQLPYGEPCWLATRYEDVRAVYGDRRFSRAAGIPHDAPGIWDASKAKDPTLLVNMDPPEHTRVRRLAAAAFSPRRVRLMETWVQELVDRLFDEMAAQGDSADFHTAYAEQLPVLVLAKILGVPESDGPDFRRWIGTGSAFTATMEERRAAHQAMNQYIAALISDRRSRSGEADDLVSGLVHARDDDDQLSEAELVSLCVTLVNGGFHTTVVQLGTTAYTLATHPDHWRELVEDPGLVPAAAEELWRWVPSFKYGVPFPRWATEDLELSFGTVIRAGEPVLPEHAVANRDDSVFPHAAELDFHRDNPKPHLALAFGAHHCMGANLANLQLRLSIEGLVERFPTLRLAVPTSDVPWSADTFMRSVESLPVAW